MTPNAEAIKTLESMLKDLRMADGSFYVGGLTDAQVRAVTTAIAALRVMEWLESNPHGHWRKLSCSPSLSPAYRWLASCPNGNLAEASTLSALAAQLERKST